MAINHSAQSNGGNGADPSLPITISHAPSGTPRGVLVYIHSPTTTDYVSSVTYGGTAMIKVGGPWTNATAPGIVHAYFLGASVPTGTQNMVATFSSAVWHSATVYSFTAADDTSVLTFDSVSGLSDVDGLLTGTLSLGGVTAVSSVGFLCNVSTATGVATLSGWSQAQETDFGTETGGSYRWATVNGSDVTYGVDMTAQQEGVIVGVAVREGAAAAASTPRNSGRLMLGIG